MSKYTIQLRNYIENGGKVFDFTYPIFDETYRTVLENNILNTYYFREIGFETVAQFKWYLKTKMNVIMPYYNQLYNSVSLIVDPMTNKDYTETRTSTGETDSNANSTGSNNDTQTYSDTPQSKLNGVDYATELTENQGSTTGTTTGKITTTDEYTLRITGNDGMRYPADVVMEYRESLINIDKMIIDELNELFMNIY